MLPRVLPGELPTAAFGSMAMSITTILLTKLSILPEVALSQSSQLVPHTWGMASNGLCVGVHAKPSDWPSYLGDFYCSIDIRNVTTNRLYIWVPPFDQRYEVKLLGPNGQPIR